MTRIRVEGKPKRNDALYGYGKWLLAEHNPSDGKRGFTTYCIYLAPDDVAIEMLAKGGVIDKNLGIAESSIGE